VKLATEKCDMFKIFLQDTWKYLPAEAEKKEAKLKPSRWKIVETVKRQHQYFSELSFKL